MEEETNKSDLHISQAAAAGGTMPLGFSHDFSGKVTEDMEVPQGEPGVRSRNPWGQLDPMPAVTLSQVLVAPRISFSSSGKWES